MVSGKRLLCIFPIVSIWELMPPPTPEWDHFDPRGMVGRTYVEHQTALLDTLYTSIGSCGFREEDFFHKPMAAIHTLWHGLYGPQGHVWQDL